MSIYLAHNYADMPRREPTARADAPPADEELKSDEPPPPAARDDLVASRKWSGLLGRAREDEGVVKLDVEGGAADGGPPRQDADGDDALAILRSFDAFAYVRGSAAFYAEHPLKFKKEVRE